MGTWENGVFDYDHLKSGYLPSYTRYWDDASKVPFLYNVSTGIWISYDDGQSIGIKTDYVKQEQLAGVMFWELSGDRQHELIDVAFERLNNDNNNNNNKQKNSERPLPNVTRTSPSTETHVYVLVEWQVHRNYTAGERIVYDDKIYQCVLSHRSLPGWTPSVVPALWRTI
jgi:chitinase